MNHRIASLAWGLIAFLCACSVRAFAQQPVVVAINEGVTYKAIAQDPRERFRDMTEDLRKLLKRPVQVDLIDSYPALKEGLEKRSYDVALVHPAHISIRALRTDAYRLVALTKGFTEYKVRFLVSKTNTMKGAAELKGQPIVIPDPDSITAWMTRATVRDLFGSPDAVVYQSTRYQDAVPFYVEHGFVSAGATASGKVAEAFTKSTGGRVLFTSKPVPIKHVIASAASLTEAERTALHDYFVGLSESDEGRRRLKTLNVDGYIDGDAQALLAIGKWLAL